MHESSLGPRACYVALGDSGSGVAQAACQLLPTEPLQGLFDKPVGHPRSEREHNVVCLSVDTTGFLTGQASRAY